jgi:asparagine synthase (glutamine-hydrolysing)
MPGMWNGFDRLGNALDSGEIWRMPGPAAPHEISIDETPFRRELREAVRLNLEHHESAPIGVLLSGGIDSSSIANLARLQAATQDQPIRTFCMAMEDPSLSEAEGARALARGMGIEHHEVMLTEQAFVATLDDAIAALDQPTFDALNQYHICRALREAGVRIAVGGIGGDAIYGGDKTLRQIPRLRRIAALAGIAPESARVGIAKLIARVMTGGGGGGIGSQQNWAKLPEVARAGGDVLNLYQLTYALFRPEFQAKLIAEETSPGSYGLPPDTNEMLRDEIANHSPINAAAILETRCFVGERLLRDADTVSSAQSLELRSPLADPRIIEALNRLPVEKKFLPVGYKPLLRKYGLENVDPKLYDRPKQGFVLPFDRWIRKNLGRVMNEVMLDPAACRAAGLRPDGVARLWQAFQQGSPGLYWTRVWAIYVLIRWCQRHNVSAATA